MPTNKKVVLVLEDDEPIRALIVRTLSTLYTVYEAADAPSGLTILAERAPPPDVIICDIMLPGTRGTDFARKMKSSPQHHGIPIILVTACTEPCDVAAGMEAGACAYITKPFRMYDLLGAVANALAPARPLAQHLDVSRRFANAATQPSMVVVLGQRR